MKRARARRSVPLRRYAGTLALGLLLVGCEPRLTSLGAWSAGDGAPVDSPDAGSTGQYLEAEDGVISGDFTIGADVRASAGEYLSPPAGVSSDDAPGEARARYAFTVGHAGTYLIWGRISSPGANSNRFWFQLDGGQWIKWRISVGDIWFWYVFHEDAQYGTPLPFALEAGAHELVLANCVPGAALDRLYITRGTETPPGNDTPCNPPNSIELAGVCQQSCGSQGGNQCSEQACQGRPLLTAYDCAVCCRVPP